MLYLLRKQIIFSCLLFATLSLKAQNDLNRPEHDELSFYPGLTFGYANMNLHTEKAQRFLRYDSVLSVDPGASGGISLGLMFTFKVHSRFDFRVAPQLIIGGARTFTYSLKYPNALENEIEKKTLTSTLFSLPAQVKFNSDRINNFRVYILGGFSYDIDMASNSNERNAEDLIKLKQFDYAVEAGVGFNFFLKFVTISPEIKIHNGINNIHDRDPDLKYSNVLGNLTSRMFVFSINVEP